MTQKVYIDRRTVVLRHMVPLKSQSLIGRGAEPATQLLDRNEQTVYIHPTPERYILGVC